MEARPGDRDFVGISCGGVGDAGQVLDRAAEERSEPRALVLSEHDGPDRLPVASDPRIASRGSSWRYDRRMAHEAMTLLAEGRTAEVYAWGDGAILKLFRDWVPRDQAEHEAEVARAVSASGLPVPWVGEIVDVDGRAGLVYERIDGPSLLDGFMKRPWTLRPTGLILARLHAELHKTHIAAAVPEQRRRLGRKIEQAGLLSSALRSRALETLAGLPDGDVLCHGDFHPGNILMTPSGPIVIDWIDATRGHPLADVARTFVIGRFGIPASGSLTQRVVRACVNRLLGIYEREYGRQTGASHAEIAPWLPVVAAARIEEGVDEAGALAAYVEQSFAPSRKATRR